MCSRQGLRTALQQPPLAFLCQAVGSLPESHQGRGGQQNGRSALEWVVDSERIMQPVERNP